MQALKRMRDRILALFRGEMIERDMDKEMRFHVEMLAEEYRKSGMPAEAARAAAARRFGNVTLLKERGRDVRGGGVLAELQQDVQYGARMLRRNPGFTAVALVALALGIGVNTAIFSIANGLFFRPAADTSEGALVRLYGLRDGGRGVDVMSYANFKDVRERSRSFSGVAAHQSGEVGVSTGADDSLESHVEIVTANYFSVFNVKLKIGRSFSDSDDTGSPELVTVISERFHRTHMASDSNPLGKRLYVNGNPFEVIGVVPEGFRGTFPAFVTDMWFPLSATEQVRPRGIPLTNRGWGWLFASGRLKPSVSMPEASAEVDRVIGQLEKEYPRQNQGLRFQLIEAGSLPDEFRSNASQFLLFFMCASAAVLLITCANIASMMLARATARGREVAIRQSLGAGRRRIVRQWITESVLLSALGGIAGVLLAIWLSRALLGFAPPEWSNFSPDVHLDWRVAVFAITLTVVTGVLFGLAPAIRATGASALTALKTDSAASIGNRRSGFYGFVVAVQVTLSLVLMIVSGLLFRSLQQSEAYRPGFDSDRLVIAQFDLRRYGYPAEARREFYNRLVANLKTMPNIAGVTHATVVPLGNDRESGGYQIEGVEPQAGKKYFSIGNDMVGPDYFATMGIPIVEGRNFDPTLTGLPTEAIINEVMAQKFWPGQSAIGHTISNDQTARIVGVVRTIPYYELGETPQPYVYIASRGNVPASLTVLVKSTGDSESIVAGVKQAIRAADSKVSSEHVVTFSELRKGPLFPARALLAVAGGFGLLALALTLIGLYGVISYSVTRRTREFGIRIALGARRAAVFEMVISEGLRLTAIGIAAGIVIALASTRFLSSLLFGVSANDPLTFVVISALMVATAAFACYLPARRATRVDPIIALREDG